jgi:NAD(P)-dependent dehydrogenase (short-subunit alcohol dehydrogenase family)
MDISTARHALITGGASGIGLGIADALVARGIAVTIADIDAPEMAQVLASRAGKLHGVPLDVRDRAGWARAKAEAEAALGPVDLLFNNAGIMPDGKQLSDMPPESFDRVIAINLTGVFNGISAFGQAFRDARRGHIVNTASMSGMAADHPGLGSYSPSKFAVIAMSEVLRKEMAPYGVGVSVLCPGYTATNLPRSTMRVGGEIVDPSVSVLESEVKPHHVAAMVLRGIEANRLYIITHPERMGAVEQRVANIRDDCNAEHGS